MRLMPLFIVLLLTTTVNPSAQNQPVATSSERFHAQDSAVIDTVFSESILKDVQRPESTVLIVDALTVSPVFSLFDSVEPPPRGADRVITTLDGEALPLPAALIDSALERPRTDLRELQILSEWTVDWIDQAEADKFFFDGCGFFFSPHDGFLQHCYLKFFETHPGYGIISVTLPGYSDDETTAIVSWSITWGPLAGGGYLALLKKTEVGWTVVSNNQVWVS